MKTIGETEVLTPKWMRVWREKRRNQDSHRNIMRRGRKESREREQDLQRAFIRLMKETQ